MRRWVPISAVAVEVAGILALFLFRPYVHGFYFALYPVILMTSVALVTRLHRWFDAWRSPDASRERVAWEVRPIGITVREWGESKFIRADRVHSVLLNPKVEWCASSSSMSGQIRGRMMVLNVNPSVNTTVL